MERINSLDVVRGVALLGLLPMNILIFALPVSSYFNPSSFQGDWWFTYLSHTVTHVIFDQKMMGIFSFLFGCSIVLIADSTKRRGRSPWLRHYLRNIVLLIFGLVHGILIWEGDILFVYALLGLLIFPLYYFSWRILLGLSILLWCVVIYVPFYQQQFLSSMSAQELATLPLWQPDAVALKEQINFVLQNYSDAVADRLNGVSPWDSKSSDMLFVNYVFVGFMRALAMMLAGMAIMKTGFWQRKEKATSISLAAICISVGWLIALAGVGFQAYQGWSVVHGLGINTVFNQVATPLVVAGYILLLKYFCEHGNGVIYSLFANVGRMAFTNYIAQSVLMTMLFFGYGLALFGSLNRLELWCIVGVVWVLQILYSNLWLHCFKYGPLEWVWRKLSFS